MKMKVGFIGVGIMGHHMATHLLNAGYEVFAYDVSEEMVKKIVAKGAKGANSIIEVTKSVDLVILMVPDSPDVEKVVFESGGILEAAHEGLIFIDMSTIAPGVEIKVAKELNVRGVRCLDAPVSGGETGAQNAALSIMVGGPEDLFNEVLPIFEVMGKTITLCGGSGAGQTVKACNQIQVALNFLGMAEAFVLGAKANVDPAIILKVLSGGYAQTRVMDARGDKLIHGDFSPGFKSRFHLKDLNIIMETAKEFNVPLPCTAVAQQLFNAMITSGRGDLDHSAVINIIEDLAKVEARTKNG